MLRVFFEAQLRLEASYHNWLEVSLVTEVGSAHKERNVVRWKKMTHGLKVKKKRLYIKTKNQFSTTHGLRQRLYFATHGLEQLDGKMYPRLLSMSLDRDYIAFWNTALSMSLDRDYVAC
ncbi:unnamed protein product [Brassica oleracea]